MDAQALARILDTLLERGYRLPIHCAVMGVNGSLIAALFSKVAGEDRVLTTCTAQYFVDDGFTLPINMLFVDSRGEAMRVVVEADGCAQFMN